LEEMLRGLNTMCPTTTIAEKITPHNKCSTAPQSAKNTPETMTHPVIFILWSTSKSPIKIGCLYRRMKAAEAAAQQTMDKNNNGASNIRRINIDTVMIK